MTSLFNSPEKAKLTGGLSHFLNFLFYCFIEMNQWKVRISWSFNESSQLKFEKPLLCLQHFLKHWWEKSKKKCAIIKHTNKQSLTSLIKDCSAVQNKACSGIPRHPLFPRYASINIAFSSSVASGEMHLSFVALNQTHSA